MRVLKGRPIKVSHEFLDDDEETPLDLSSVSVTLTDATGTDVATETATSDGQGNWTATFAAQPLGPYVATWQGDATYTDETPVEVVGGFLFSVKQARGDNSALKDAEMFTASEILAKREEVETEFERITHRSFTTRVRYRDFVADGSGVEWMLNPDSQAIESVTVNGTALDDLTGWSVSTLGAVTYPVASGCLTTGGVYDGDAISVRIRYGFATPPPDVSRVGAIRVADLINQEDSGLPGRATTWQPEEGGTFRLATPGLGKWQTGIPEVDSTLMGYRLDSVMAVYGASG